MQTAQQKMKNYKKRITICNFSYFGHSMLRQKINNKGSNIHQKTPLKFMLQFGSILESAWLDLGRGWGSKWSQKMAPKSLPKSIPKSIKKMITFWIVSRSIPEPCGLLPSTLVYLLRAICNSELCRFVLWILKLITIQRTALRAVNRKRFALSQPRKNLQLQFCTWDSAFPT